MGCGNLLCLSYSWNHVRWGTGVDKGGGSVGAYAPPPQGPKWGKNGEILKKMPKIQRICCYAPPQARRIYATAREHSKITCLNLLK